METINLNSEVVKEEKTPKKVDWNAYVEKELPNWHFKYKRVALDYLFKYNPKSVILTDKPIRTSKSTVIVGGKDGIREFVSELEEKGYEKVFFRKFPTVGIMAIMEVK